jgi:GTP cyclohydrolase I
LENNEEVHETPLRAAKALIDMTAGYHIDLNSEVKEAVFKSHDSKMVVVNNITVNSLCEHHMLPFFGKCAIAYIPDEKILGLSKFSRIVNAFSRRF